MEVRDLQKLANIIALAQDISEESFIHSNGAMTRSQGSYSCSMYNAALKAAAQVTNLPHEHVIVEGIAQLVYLLNSELWNDIQAWNADILKLPEEV